MSEKIGMGLSTASNVEGRRNLSETLGLKDFFQVDCYDVEGNLKWSDTISNLVTDEGLTYALNALFTSGTQYTENVDWRVGLINANSPSAADTAANLPNTNVGWNEITDYSNTNRPLLNLAGITGSGGTLSMTNSASVATFNIVTPATDVAGCFIVAGTNAQTPGGSVTGVLYGVGGFTGGTKVVDANDTLNVTVTVQASG